MDQLSARIMAYSRKYTLWIAYALLLLKIGYVSHVDAQAEGDILIYDSDWVVSDDGSNTVNATLTMQIDVTSMCLCY